MITNFKTAPNFCIARINWMHQNAKLRDVKSEAQKFANFKIKECQMSALT